MDFDQTIGGDDDEPEHDSHDELGAELFEVAHEQATPGFETRRQKAMVAAALFDEPATPTKIGRFTIVRELGAGGMGVVYVAYDEQLDRRVAVKLLRGSDTDTRGRVRLEREAQAMARLSHPHVVTVHEVGTHQDQVYLAMEFVEGGDLRAWLAAERRGWRAIVDVFRQAGEGLAAAHEAGIVHRDFKPDNVLVGSDGRVRVADFGLAHGHVEGFASEHAPVELDSGSNSQLERSLTNTGALMGTPAYMAPEQYAGRRTDARTDQFAFCVALWEGLYGVRPFFGANLIELSTAIVEGRIVEPPAETEVPPWLRAALTRGLARAPEDRWPSMRELLDTLANDPQARRRRRLRLAAIVSLTAAALVGLSYTAATALRENARRQYWAAFTEQLLELERVRGVRQANDDALRARDATRMSVYRSYRPRGGIVDHEDPTVAAALLREVEGEARESSEWISAANEILGQPLSYAVLDGHRDVVTSLAFAPDEQALYSGAADGEVWRWEIATGRGERIIAHDADKEVTAVVVSPDGRTVVSAGRDGAVRAWSREAGARVLVRHEDEIDAIAIAPDGRRIATASRDRTAIIALLDGDERVTLRGHAGKVHAVAFDPTGTRVLTASADATARVWTIAGEPIATLAGHTAAIFHAQFVTPDEIATGSDDGDVRAWRLSGATVVDARTLGHHPGGVASLAVHDRTIAAGSLDGRVAIATLDDPASWRVLATHAKGVWALAFTPDGAGLVSASFDTTARLHDLRHGGPARTFMGHRLALLSSSVSASGRWLATGAWDGNVRIWDLRQEPLALELEGHAKNVASVELDATGTRVFTASHDGSVMVWDAGDGHRIATLDSGHGPLQRAVVSPDGRLAAAASKAGIIDLWTLETGELVSLVGHGRSVWAVSFDATSQRLGSASGDRSARIWSVSGEQLLLLEGHEARVSGIDLGAGGQPIATVSDDGTLRLWDPEDGHPLAILRGHEGRVVALARSPAGVIATASDDGTARLWPDADPARSIVLRGHSKPLWAIAFDPTGARVVTSSYDATARVWDTSDGRSIATLEGHGATVWGAKFIDSDRVVTVSDDHTIRIWTIGDDTLAIVLTGHSDAIMDVAVSSEGRLVATASADRKARIWRLARLSTSSAELADALARASVHCLDVKQRIHELGEAPSEAALAFARCDQRQMELRDPEFGIPQIPDQR